MPTVAPGPDGGLFGMRSVKQFLRNPLEFLAGLGHTHGDLTRLRLGPNTVYLVNHPDLIRDVLVSKARSFRKEARTVRILGQVDGKGLVLTEGDFWLRQRRLMQPAFHTRRMSRYTETIVSKVEKLADRWRQLPSGSRLPVVDEMTHLTLEIIAKLFFDVELTGNAAQLGEAVHVLSDVFKNEASSFFTLPDWLPLQSKRRKKLALEALDRFIWDVIRTRRVAGTDQGDLLSMLLLAVDEEGDGQRMTDQQVRDEAITMFNAGHDSTAAALAWIWWLIAEHPEIETALRTEAQTVLGDRSATFADVPRLMLADQVVREALRLYPPVWLMFTREAVENVELGGVEIPKGSWIYISPWVTQRDPRFFPDPLKFDPARFAPGHMDGVSPYAWIPFGGGPHICIGMTLAITEMVLIVSTLIREFRLRMPPNQPPVVPEPLLAIRPLGGLPMDLERV